MLAFVVSAKIGEPLGGEGSVVFEAMKSSVAFEMRLLIMNPSVSLLTVTREAAHPTFVPLETTYLETGYTRTFFAARLGAESWGAAARSMIGIFSV